MTILLNLLLGFQIGIQLTAACIAYLISRQKFVPRLPYRVAALNLFIMSLARIDYLVDIYNDNFRIYVLATISILWLLFFSKIYVLVRNK